MRAVLFLLVALLVPVTCGASDVLERARPFLPVLASAFDVHWPAAPYREHAGGQVEQESSWKPRAQLKTSRELGRGLTQMTIAYDAQGRERFNIYRSAVKMAPLRAWDWQADPFNAKYQLTFLVLQDRYNFTQMRPLFVNDLEAVKAELVSYNAGPGRVLKRRAYARLKGIPLDRWTNGLEGAYTAAEGAILYGRPLYEAVNEYPRVVMKRSEKYRGLLGGKR